MKRILLNVTAATALASLTLSPTSFAKGGDAMTEPMLAPYAGAHGGVPAFDKIKPAEFKPSLMKAMDAFRKEIAAIADNKQPATFDNTIAALEDSGRAFNRASILLGIYTSTMSDKQMQAIEQELAPVLAAFSDEITQNEALFARVKAVYDARATTKLTPEQQRLLDVVYRNFARRGAALGKAQKARLAEINQQLAKLYTTFGQNQLSDEETYTLAIDKEADLAGLPDTLKASL
ncbi:MAG: M3 family metallopeptidase, partial [Kofleriaceae bacterium]